MNIKGIIISSGEEYKTFDCEISVPALKIHMNEDVMKEVGKRMQKAEYTNIIFMMSAIPVEVAIYKKEENLFYANAKEIATLDLDKLSKLKENTLVKKHLENMQEKKKVNKPKKEEIKHIEKEIHKETKVEKIIRETQEQLKRIKEEDPMESVVVGNEVRSVTLAQAEKLVNEGVAKPRARFM